MLDEEKRALVPKGEICPGILIPHSLACREASPLQPPMLHSQQNPRRRTKKVWVVVGERRAGSREIPLLLLLVFCELVAIFAIMLD